MLSLASFASPLISRVALSGFLAVAQGGAAAGGGAHAPHGAAAAVGGASGKAEGASKSGKAVGKQASDKSAQPKASAKGAGGAAGSASPGVALEPAVAAVVSKVQAKYDGARDFTAAFDQTLTNSVTKRATVSGGKVTFKKAGKMRWDYTSPEPRMVLADGNQLWLWEPEDQQAFKQELASSQLPAALAFLTGRGKLTDEFVIGRAKSQTYGKAGDDVLELLPKKPSAQVQRVFFVVDPASAFVRETIVVDGQGSTNHLVFRDIRVNTSVPDAFFAWSPPAGTRVIDPSGATPSKKP